MAPLRPAHRLLRIHVRLHRGFVEWWDSFSPWHRYMDLKAAGALGDFDLNLVPFRQVPIQLGMTRVSDDPPSIVRRAYEAWRAARTSGEAVSAAMDLLESRYAARFFPDRVMTATDDVSSPFVGVDPIDGREVRLVKLDFDRATDLPIVALQASFDLWVHRWFKGWVVDLREPEYYRGALLEWAEDRGVSFEHGVAFCLVDGGRVAELKWGVIEIMGVEPVAEAGGSTEPGPGCSPQDGSAKARKRP